MEQLQTHPAIAKFKVTSSSHDGTVVDGPAQSAASALISNIEAWVTSERLILFQQQPSPSGVSIPYPTIALHATMRWKSTQSSPSDQGVEALYMELSMNDTERVNDDDDIEILEITVLPPNYESSPNAAATAPCIQELYSAMNVCSDLHPDPASPSSDVDEGEGAMPSAGGWITSENLGEYFDENGNFIGGGKLGAGAGTVRPREEDEDMDGRNGHENAEEAAEETKWRRTQ